LKDAIDKGIIDVATIREEIEMNERKKYLEQHQYKKWLGKDGHWYTYLPDERTGRRLVRKKLEKSIDDEIVSYYKMQACDPSVREVFDAWVEEKLTYAEIQKQSYDKYRNEFERFFANEFCSIAERKIRYIDEDELERFIKINIVKLNLTYKAFSNMRILINGIFKYAKKHKYTTLSITNFMGDLALSPRSFKKVIREKQSEVFLEDEIPMVMDYLNSNEDIYNQGIWIAFLAGVRVGELAALKYEDLKCKQLRKTGEDMYVLCIRRTEVKYKDANGQWQVGVREIPKTEAGIRDIIINQEVVDVIERIHAEHPDSEYLFMNHKGKRIRGNTFNKRLSVICDKLGIPHRTMHKIRKTYGTTLLDSDVDDALVAEMMGHKDVATTRQYYYFSNKGTERQMEQMQRALQNIGS
jgi:integrase